MMYSNILSLICTVWMLLIPCAARVIVRDTVRAVLNAAEARSTPVDSALRQLNVHEKASPSRVRAVDRRANEPRETFTGNIWQPTTRAGVAARQSVVERAEGPVGGFLFQDAVHDKIAES
ncbi:uncharacterized protein BJ212DRAFT_1296466 [Suillus subaureus]|uniref:Uncharacterized protein n=1 Tax=Suillus subaureus TaxID=48587 RepID=A0A9P7JIA5_9AGAM|nr:uncharacterized protein BJ212DRAFT_1296466 [Suillus subaureus]KAG1823950.1 hypothetical protein BJ212DRAFT_1296466 [Suillus subaureus]